MSDSLQIRGGAKSAIPTFLQRELGFCKDAFELYIGTETGNVLLASKDAAEGKYTIIQLKAQTPVATAPNGAIFEDEDDHLKYKNLLGDVKDLSVKAAACETLGLSSTLGDVINKINEIISALRAAGLMEESE